MNGLILSPAPTLLPAQLYAPTPQAAKRVLEFFTKRFADWCEKHGLRDLVDVEPIHVTRLRQGSAGQFLIADSKAASGGATNAV